jgi:hypothetical protein
MKLSPVLAFTAALAGTAGAQPVDDRNVPSIDDPNFISRIMDGHWYWRRIHCAQDLTWDPKLAEAARESVNKCTQQPKHVSTDTTIALNWQMGGIDEICFQDRAGSNLSSASIAPETYEIWLEFARTVVHGWHDEELEYDYADPKFDKKTGHFTQLVWRDSSRIGCAMAHCPENEVEWPGRLYCCKCTLFMLSDRQLGMKGRVLIWGSLRERWQLHRRLPAKCLGHGVSGSAAYSDWKARLGVKHFCLFSPHLDSLTIRMTATTRRTDLCERHCGSTIFLSASLYGTQDDLVQQSKARQACSLQS